MTKKITLFGALRKIHGFLTQRQVDATNRVMATASADDVSEMLGLATASVEHQLSQRGIELITSFEGLRLQAYRDIVNVVTIGYGHTKTAQMGQIITKEQAINLLKQDVAGFEVAINRLVKVPLNQNQFDALVSLAFNIGSSALRDSTLLKKLNSGDYSAASAQFDVWNRAGGKVVSGLVRRRAAERQLFDARFD